MREGPVTVCPSAKAADGPIDLVSVPRMGGLTQQGGRWCSFRCAGSACFLARAPGYMGAWLIAPCVHTLCCILSLSSAHIQDL